MEGGREYKGQSVIERERVANSGLERKSKRKRERDGVREIGKGRDRQIDRQRYKQREGEIEIAKDKFKETKLERGMKRLRKRIVSGVE